MEVVDKAVRETDEKKMYTINVTIHAHPMSPRAGAKAEISPLNDQCLTFINAYNSTLRTTSK